MVWMRNHYTIYQVIKWSILSRCLILCWCVVKIFITSKPIDESTHPGPSFINQLISYLLFMTANDNNTYLNRLFVSVHNRYNWINHEFSKKRRRGKKKKKRSKQKQMTIIHDAKNWCFRELYMLSFVTVQARKAADYVLKLECCFQSTKLTRKWNFRWKPI